MTVDLSSYDDETVYLAFWLQHEIYTRGLEGHGFMQDSRDSLEKDAGEILEDNIEDELAKL